MKIKAVGAIPLNNRLNRWISPGVNRDRICQNRNRLLWRLPFRSPPGPSEWAGTVYPCVPGHEIVGRV